MTPEEKFEICKSCEYLNTKGLSFARNICQKCGCYMPIKVNIPMMKCPIGKW